MTKRFRNILVTTDTRLETHPIVDEAAEVAIRSGASLKLVDVVPPLSWLARITMDDPDEVAKAMIARKAEQLKVLAEPIRERGVKITTKVLFGTTSVEIIREVLRGQHDLVLRVAKAKTSRRSGFFGATGIELLRKCPCAVWLVCSTTSAQFNHVMACVDTDKDSEVGEELDEKVFEIATDISQRHAAKFSLIHAWTIDGEQFMRKRMSKAEFEEMQRNRYNQVKSRLDNFLAKHHANLSDSQIQLVKAEPYDAIPAVASQLEVDLAVMGLAARHGPSEWIGGNITEQVLDSLRCSVLALKPSSFVSPIKLPDEDADAASKNW